MKVFRVTVIGDGAQKKEFLIGTEPTSIAAKEKALRRFSEPWIPKRIVIEDVR